MENLKVAVILKQSRTRIKVYPKWIMDVDYQAVFNSGMKKSDDRIIFYSPDPDSAPNFELPVSEVFDATIDGCYVARVFRGFGKFCAFD